MLNPDSAIASELYEILKSKIKKYIEKTNHPTLPTYKRYFGKVKTLPFQRTAQIRRARITSVETQQLRNFRAM